MCASGVPSSFCLSVFCVWRIHLARLLPPFLLFYTTVSICLPALSKPIMLWTDLVHFPGQMLKYIVSCIKNNLKQAPSQQQDLQALEILGEICRSFLILLGAPRFSSGRKKQFTCAWKTSRSCWSLQTEDLAQTQQYSSFLMCCSSLAGLAPLPGRGELLRELSPCVSSSISFQPGTLGLYG